MAKQSLTKKNLSKKESFINRLADALVKRNILKDAEAESLIKEYKGRAKDRIENILLDDGIVDRESLMKVLQTVYGVPPFDVRGHFFNHQLLLLFPKEFLMSKGLIPLDVDDDIITVVMSNPEDEEALDTLGNYVAYNVSIYVGIHRDIVDSIEEYYDEDIVTSETYEQEEDVTEDDEDDSDIVDLY